MQPVALPQLSDLARDWHLQARCLPSEDGDRWAMDYVFGSRWDRKWFAATHCSGCPVADECLDDAMAFRAATGFHPEGVWGGLNEPQRERLWNRLMADAIGAESAPETGEAA